MTEKDKRKQCAQCCKKRQKKTKENSVHNAVKKTEIYKRKQCAQCSNKRQKKTKENSVHSAVIKDRKRQKKTVCTVQ